MTDLPYGFASDLAHMRRMVPEVFHCGRCHNVVRTYDADTEQDALVMLQGHSMLNCVDDPGYMLLS